MQMRGVLSTAGVVAVLALLSAPRAGDAQVVHRYAVGWMAGVEYMTELNSHPHPGFEVDPRSISPGLGFTVGLHVERWMGEAGRLGVRAQGSYQQPRMDLAWRDERREVNAFSGDVALMYRLISPLREGAFLPYVMAGGGASWYDLGPATAFDGTDASYDGQLRPMPLATVGVGVDTPPIGTWDNDPIRIRFELADHLVVRSPLRRTSDWQRHGSVHQMRFTVGVYSALGWIN
jgi:hypothetical protein